MKNKNKYFELVKDAITNVSMYIKQWSTCNNDKWEEHLFAQNKEGKIPMTNNSLNSSSGRSGAM